MAHSRKKQSPREDALIDLGSDESLTKIDNHEYHFYRDHPKIAFFTPIAVHEMLAKKLLDIRAKQEAERDYQTHIKSMRSTTLAQPLMTEPLEWKAPLDETKKPSRKNSITKI